MTGYVISVNSHAADAQLTVLAGANTAVALYGQVEEA